MTISSETNSVSYTGDGTLATYTVGLDLTDDDEFVLYEQTAAGVPSTLVRNTDYTVSYVGGVLKATRSSGVLPSGYIWTFERDPAYTQESDYRGNPAYNPERYELDYDKSVERDQALLAKVDRALTVPPAYVSFDTQVTPVAGGVLAINGDNDGFTTITGLADAPVSSAMQPVVAAASLAAARAAMGPWSDALATATGGTSSRSMAEHFADRVAVEDFGAVGDGTTDDTAAIQAAIDSLSRGGTIHFRAKNYRTTSTLTVYNKPIMFQGSSLAAATSRGTTLTLAVGGSTGISFEDADGSGIRDMLISGSGVTAGYLITVGKGSGSSGTFLMSVTNVRLANGYNGIWFKSANSIRFLNFSTTNFTGQQVMLLNGDDDSNRADPVEFLQCSISAGSSSTNEATDNVVCDGLSGSIKFVETAILFGRHGLWFKNTTLGAAKTITGVADNGSGLFRITAASHGYASGDEVLISGVDVGSSGSVDLNSQWLITKIDNNNFDLVDSTWVSSTYTGGQAQKVTGRAPSFAYFNSGGFENGLGDGIKLDAGNHVMVSGTYISTDGDGSGINVGNGFNGELTVSGTYIRGNGRDGVRLGKGYATLSGCTIVNNGRVRVDVGSKTVSGAANNGSGLIRITTSSAHGYATGDKVTVSSVNGTTEANGSWAITVISSTTFDLVGSTFSTTYTNGGSCIRYEMAVSGVANNGSGLCRVTTVTDHPFLTDDIVEVAGVGGATQANGKWKITKITSTTFDLVSSAYSSAYTSGGTVKRLGYGIRTLSSAEHITVTGGRCGRASTGLNRQDYGIYNESKNILYADVDLYGNVTGTINNTQVHRSVRMRETLPTEQIDGVLTAEVTGAAAVSYYNFKDLRYLAGRKIRIIRCTRKSSSGSCTVRVGVDGAPSSLGTVTCDSTLTSSLYGTAVDIDGTSSPKLLQLQIATNAAANDVVVQFEYQIIG